MSQEEALVLHAPGTGGWFQDSQEFRRWVDGEVKKMGCHGMRTFMYAAEITLRS